MSADDEQDRASDAGGTGADAGASGAGAGDPLRDLMLGLASQIDQVAAIFGGAGWRDQTNAAGDAGNRTGAFSIDTDGLATAGVSFAGEISTLIAEIGDLLSRLIAALIAVLEAVARALRHTPATPAEPTRGYQPITVHIDPGATPNGPATNQPGDAGRDT